MIFVTLGTQDKGFPRLLKAIDREIEKGNIKEEVVVQAGYTKYSSPNMKIFDLVDEDTFDKYMKNASLVITHGGAGSILTAIKYGKKVIAAPRLSMYHEHTNDHQKQIVSEFSQEGYILELNDFNKLGELIRKSRTFKPKKYKSNTSNIINLIDNYIEDSNSTSWFNKYRSFIIYVIIGILLRLLLVSLFHSNIMILELDNIICWFIILMLIRSKESIRIINFIIDSIIMYICYKYNVIYIGIIISIVINYIIIKLCGGFYEE